MTYMRCSTAVLVILALQGCGDDAKGKDKGICSTSTEKDKDGKTVELCCKDGKPTCKPAPTEDTCKEKDTEKLKKALKTAADEAAKKTKEAAPDAPETTPEDSGAATEDGAAAKKAT